MSLALWKNAKDRFEAAQAHADSVDLAVLTTTTQAGNNRNRDFDRALAEALNDNLQQVKAAALSKLRDEMRQYRVAARQDLQDLLAATEN